MRIALLGYGKMGKAIEEVALSRGHSIVCRVGIENLEDRTLENLRRSDVVIEFTGPDSAAENLLFCLEAGVPVVCGSTGWLQRFAEVQEAFRQKEGGLLYASNFSVGVNLFFAVNRLLAKLMRDQPSYEVDIREVHHTQKLDAPSGTAITLAEQVIANLGRKKTWVSGEAHAPEELPIHSERRDPAPGTHTVSYRSDIDDIVITHTAHNRRGFATGAVLAAEFLYTRRKGLFTMEDVLGVSPS